MSQSSDVTYRELKTTSSQTLRLSTLREANDILSNAILKLPIYPYYSIDFELLFSSVDGQKYELETPTDRDKNIPSHIQMRCSSVSVLVVSLVQFLLGQDGLVGFSVWRSDGPFVCEVCP